MKNMYVSLCGGLKAWPVFRGVCAFAIIVSISEFLVLAIMDQFTSVALSVTNINLIVWHLHIPFGVSRLWDIVLLPLFVYLSFKHESYREDKYFDRFGRDEHYKETILDLTQVALCGAMIGSSIFGILYAIPMFVAVHAIWIFVGSVLILVEGITLLFAGIWKVILH